MLKAWRKAAGLTLAQAAQFLGLKAASQVHYIENGDTFPTPETVAQIQGATKGAVTFADHWRAWRRRHPKEYSQSMAAGRSAAKAYRSPAKPKKGSRHGGESNRRG